MKIIYSGIQKDSYNSSSGKSFEYNNFYLTLKALPYVEVIEYPFDRILDIGKEKWNNELFEICEKEKPDLLFVFMYTDEFIPSILDAIKKTTKSVAWFADDYWRFWNYSKKWSPHFNLVVTTYFKALDWYKKEGLKNAVLSQWACNTQEYKPMEFPKDINVSFVGQYKSGRGKVLRQLQKLGIKVEAFGFGWPNGKVSQEKMLEIFSRSKINLNINARLDLFHPKVLARIFLRKSINHIKPDFHLFSNFKAYRHFKIHHLHARPFELAGCKAFTISGYSEGIEKYYQENQEMVFYYSVRDLADKINYYLNNPLEREKIAQAGYERTLRDHTYKKRFEEIFKKLELKI